MELDDSITIVYKTYKQDLEWIYYSLLSLKKYVKGIYTIIIYCHDECCGELYELINRINLVCTIIPVHYNYHGYLKQMVIKANCFNDVKTKYIAIIDSDNIFNVEFNIKDLIEPSGKIIWRYTNIINDAKVWRESYENMTKTPQNIHYMANGFPFVLTTKSMSDAYTKFQEIHGVDYDTFCNNGCNKYNIRVEDPITGVNGRFLDLAKIFEEFEWLGYYCHNFSEDYIFISNKIIQYWSHGGLTPDIKKQIEDILH